MSNVLGLRVEPKKVHFCIYSEENKNEIIADKIIVPCALTIPQQLKYIRTTMLDIMSEFNVSFAGLKETEGQATPDKKRLQIESVILELFASSSIKKYFLGKKTSISPRLGFKSSEFDNIVNSDNYEPIPDWNDFKKNEKEAILVAMAVRK